jgi:2-polyprenyl-6-methoxyphenol hydroxylase-like FAD-dependent oxidoreductase
MSEFKVIVVGGGLSGACLANGLLNNKSKLPLKVAVFERDSEDGNRAGYQIRLGSHALSGFRACLTKEQFENLMLCFGRSGGSISSAPVLFDRNLKLLIDLSKFPAYTKSAPISRARLRDFLQAPLRTQNVIRFGKTFSHFESLKDGLGEAAKIRVHFSDGSVEDGDVLIASDGNASRSNRQVGCNNIVPITSKQGFLGKCDLPWKVLKTLPQQIVEKGTISCMSNGLIMFAAAYLPDSRYASQPANFDHHQEELVSGKSAIDYDETQASLMVGLNWEADSAWPNIEDMPDKKAYMLQKVKDAGWHPGYHRLVEALDPDEIYVVTARVAKETPVDWRRKVTSDSENRDKKDVGNPRVWLIGDAIHPMLPSRGMGANQALHDTADALGPLLELARLKKENGTLSDGDIQMELEKYEQMMIPRSFEWVKKSGGVDGSVC